MVVIRSLLMWGYMAVTVPLYWSIAFSVWLLTSLFDRRRVLLHMYTSVWAGHFLWIAPMWRLKFEGRENIKWGQNYVLVANHQSLADTLVMFAMLKPFKWVSKASVFKVPFVGWNMRMNDYVGVERKDEGSIRRMLKHCKRHLQARSSLFIFPEGTRSRDGLIRRFKHGAFSLAIDANVPVVPIALEGTMQLLPKDGFLFRHDADVLVRVLKPIHPDEAGGDRDLLRDMVRGRIAEDVALRRGVGVADVIAVATLPADIVAAADARNASLGRVAAS